MPLPTIALLLLTLFEASPSSQPPEYTGWVGEFTIRTSIEPTTITVGVPLDLTVTIMGTGKPGQPPNLRQKGFVERFEIVGPIDPRVTTNAESVLATFVYTLAPLSEEVSRIPPLRWAYFDPDQQSYETIFAPSIEIEVESAPTLGVADLATESSPAEPKLWTGMAALSLAGLAAGVGFLLWRLMSVGQGAAPAVGAGGFSPEVMDSLQTLMLSMMRTRVPPEQLMELGQRFNKLIAMACGLPPSSATAAEITRCAHQILPKARARELESLLISLDRLRYGRLSKPKDLSEFSSRLFAWIKRVERIRPNEGRS